MAEFDLIARIRACASTREDVLLGIGDDAALLRVPHDRLLVVATDTLNAGVHFPEDTAPADIGWKALAVNLSDLAAMGAQPAWCTLSLSLPDSNAVWLDGFLDGFLGLAAQHGVALVGGDTTRGPLSICVTAHGLVEPDRALRRDGARVGDEVWVTGTLGDAAGALTLLLPLPAGEGEVARSRITDSRADERPSAEREGRNRGECTEHSDVEPSAEPSPRPPLRAPARASDAGAPPHARQWRAISASSPRRERDLNALRARLDRPTPRIAASLALAEVAHAAIDLSDGLLADLGHVCRASGVAAELELDALPCSQALRSAGFDESRQRELQTSGGDDYELCFTAAPSQDEAIAAIARETGTSMTRIGRIVAGDGVRMLQSDGSRWIPSRDGYDHFP